MPTELVTSLNLCIKIGLIAIPCYATVKGYIAESVEHKTNNHHTSNETKPDEEISEVMGLVRFFTAFLFATSLLMLFFYGMHTKTTLDPIVMEMFLWATFLYFGHDVVWIAIGLCWFTGVAIYHLLTEFRKPPYTH